LLEIVSNEKELCEVAFKRASRPPRCGAKVAFLLMSSPSGAKRVRKKKGSEIKRVSSGGDDSSDSTSTSLKSASRNSPASGQPDLALRHKSESAFSPVKVASALNLSGTYKKTEGTLSLSSSGNRKDQESARAAESTSNANGDRRGSLATSGGAPANVDTIVPATADASTHGNAADCDVESTKTVTRAAASESAVAAKRDDGDSTRKATPPTVAVAKAKSRTRIARDETATVTKRKVRQKKTSDAAQPVTTVTTTTTTATAKTSAASKLRVASDETHSTPTTLQSKVRRAGLLRLFALMQSL
jgi:hypothetical protein